MYAFISTLLRPAAFVLCIIAYGSAQAETANVAVASNFRPAMERLEAKFEAETTHDLSVSYGATGQIFAQVRHGAPYDVVLAADAERPALLVTGSASPLPAQTYALGRLALWSPRLGSVDAASLSPSELRFLAIANESLAPYGLAAIDVLRSLGLLEPFETKLVRGSNVAQAFVFVQTGNAELGFVALSQILSLPKDRQGAYWLVPSEHYQPIRQDAVLLERGKDNPAAHAFFTFLFSEPARAIIKDAGYDLP